MTSFVSSLPNDLRIPYLARIRERLFRKLSPRRRLACILTGCFLVGAILAQVAVG